MPDNILVATKNDLNGAHQQVVQEFLDGAGAPIPVSAANPLPVAAVVSTVGLATSAGQTAGNNSLASIDTKLPSGLAMVGDRLKVEIPAGASGLTDAELRATPVPVSVTGGGDASAANQTTGNNSLASIDGKTPALGQALAAASSPVVLTAAQLSALTPPAAITGFNLEATQLLIQAKTDNIPAQGQALAAASLPVVLTAAQVTTLTPQTNALTDAQLRATPVPVNGIITTGGLTDTELRATPVPVSISSDIEIGAVELKNATTDDRVAVINIAPTTEFGVVTRNIPSGTQPVSGAFFQATQPVSAASLPLPSGAATAANQQTNALTDTELRATPVPISGTITATPTGTQSVDVTANTIGLSTAAKQDLLLAELQLKADLTETQPVSAASLPLPTGAATSALQSTGNTSLGNIDTKIPALGQALAAASTPVVLTAAQVSTLTPPAAITGFSTAAKQDLLLAELQLKADLTETQPVSLASLPALAAGASNIGDVDIASIAAGDTTIGRVKLTDGTDVADILDLTNSNPLTVAIVDANGDQITSFGGGTQYTEDAVAAANPVGTAAILVRADTPSATVTTDGDNVAQRGTNYGAAYSQIVTSTGAFVDTFGGGTQYTEGDTDATISGTAMLMEGAANTLVPAQGTVADGLLVNLGANNDVTVTGSVAVTGPLTDAQLRATPVPVSGTVTTTATDLDIRNLVFATDKVDVSGSTLAANSGVDIGDVTVNNAAGASAVNVQDGGNSLTVDGTVAFSNTTIAVTNAGTFATQATLAAGTNNIGDVDVLSLPSLPAGTNNIGDVDVLSLPAEGTISTVNSSTATLGVGAVFTGTLEEITNYSSITVYVFSNVASATDGLSMQQSIDGTNWDNTDVYTIPAATGKTFGVQCTARYFRLVYTNGGTIQGSFRLQTIFHKIAQRTSTIRPQDARSNDNDFTETVSYLSGYNGATWDRLRSDITNGLDVDVTRFPIDITNSGSITAISQSITLALAGQSGASVQVTGTWVGTLQFEGTTDGSTWVAINAVAASTASPQPTTTVNGLYRLTPGGLTSFRVTSTAWTSGTASITMLASLAVGGTFVNQVLPVSVFKKATYRSTTTAVLVAAVTSPNPWFTIYGSATKTIRVQSITVSGLTLTAVAYLNMGLRKYSTAVSGGTSTALTMVPLDSTSAAGTATNVRAYTAIPTAGTTVGDLSSRRVIGQATTAVAAGVPQVIDFDLTTGNGTEVTLRGISEGVGLYWITAPATAVSMLIRVEWTEE